MGTTMLHLNGKTYVVLERSEYDELKTLAKAADLPPLPEADEKGNYPAIQYARASIARSVITERVEAGLTQKELAKLAGIRVETLCRIETGKHTPSVASIDRIDRVLKKGLARKQGKGR